MANMPNPDPRILEALESCRPGSDDASDPEMTSLAMALAASHDLDEMYERLQQTDSAVGEAFRNVPVPDGLHQRILAQLTQAETIAAEGVKTEVRSRSLADRRLWLAALAASVALAAVFLANLLPQPQALSSEELLVQAISFYASDAARGQVEPPTSAPDAYSWSPQLPRHYYGWRRVNGFLGEDRTTIAYDMNVGGVQATLYVTRYAPSLFGPTPPASPRNTGGRSAAAWQAEDLLYVLVMDGDEDQYQQIIYPSHLGPIT